jgi:hypothetical protein
MGNNQTSYIMKYIVKGQLYNTSNNQLVCLSNHILSRSGLPIPTGWVFDNGTVLKLLNNSVKMIHPLVVSNPVRFVSPKTFNDAFVGVSLEMPTDTVVFVGRHGHGGHNDPAATLFEAHDAVLTPTGETQARDAAKAILADEHYRQLTHFRAYCSDLRRTMDTCRIFLDEIQQELRRFHALSGMPLSQFSMRWSDDTIGVDTVHTCEVCIESHEYSRLIGYDHHWQVDNPLRKVAIDPFLSAEELQVLAPEKPIDIIKRMRIENLPKNDPRGKPDECLTRIGNLKIDWRAYADKLNRAEAEGKTYGQAASEKLLLEVILENAQLAHVSVSVTLP